VKDTTTSTELHAITRFKIANFGSCKILKCNLPDEVITHSTTVKVFTTEEIKIDCDYIFYGKYVTHHKFGTQFHASAFTEHEPLGEIGCLRYLTQLPGIGGVTAEKIWRKYGNQAIKTLRENFQKVYDETSGVSVNVLREASEELRAKHGNEYVMTHLIELFAGYGFPKNLSARVIKLWGVDAPRKIKAAPYELLKFSGVGFLRCDQLYIKEGHDPAALERQMHCIRHEIKRDSDGHTWFSIPWAQECLEKHIAGTSIRRREAIVKGIEENVFAVQRDADNPYIALAENARAEEHIAAKIKMILEDKAAWPSVDHDTLLTDHQKEIIKHATRDRIGILSGSAGTGKTTTAGQLIYHLINHESIDESEIAIVAPTGKAAVRITEVMAASGIPLTATTIHSFLGVQHVTENYGQDFKFNYDETNQVEKKYIIVDEMSMLTTSLVDSLLRALPDDVHILFVGDLAQLPPVGSGAPIRDMIAAGVQHGALTEILRHSGAIVATASKIRNGEPFSLPRAFDFSQDKKVNLRIQSTSNDEYSQRAVSNTVNEIYNYKWTEIRSHKDLKRMVQVIVAVNKNSKVSREILNQMLQLQMNGKNKTDEKFWIDDKIICLKNQHLPKSEPTDRKDKGGVYTANGEIGYVEKILPGYYAVNFSGNILIVPKGDNLKHFSLAYAITCHKMQGDSAPHVIVCIDTSYNAARICNRSWLYTAITRATERDYIIGPEAVFRDYAGNVSHTRRKTFLKELILQ